MLKGGSSMFKSESKYLNTQKSKDWIQVAGFFKNHRRAGWQTIRIFTNGTKRKRMDFHQTEKYR